MLSVRLPIRPLTLTAPALALLLFFLAGCATTNTTPLTPPGSTPAGTNGAAPPSAENGEPPATASETGSNGGTPDVSPPNNKPDEDPAATPVVDQLAAQLRIPRDSIEVLQVTRAEWPNTCLGLPAEDEICGMMITPGYAISLAAGGQRYEYRTDETGRRIRLASAPRGTPGSPLLTWRDSRSFSMLVVGTERVAFGRRGRPQLVAPLGVPERAKELEKMLAEYAPFQARTPAGEVALTGVGSAHATPTDLRRIAEWAKLVSAEAEKGLEERAADRALVWRRQGGIAGFCDLVVIGRAGAATAYSCRAGMERETARIELSTDEMTRLFGWLDQIETFSSRSDDPAMADGMSITLDFAGDGIDPASEADRDAIMAFVNRVVTRLFTATAAN